jgi:hypothetical protein
MAMAQGYVATIGGTYHYPPPLVRAVRGSIEIGKEIRAVEICGGDPRVLVIITTFQWTRY